MKHTEHYQLSQFEGDDRILREDFNADNQKIDTALASEAQARAAGDCMVKLIDQTLVSNTLNWNISTTGINLDDYAAFILYPNFVTSSNSIYMQLNQLSGNSYHVNGQYKSRFLQFDSPSNSLHQAIIRKSPSFIAGFCTTFTKDGAQNISSGSISLSSLNHTITSLNFVPYDGNNNLEVGSRVALYGIKR